MTAPRWQKMLSDLWGSRMRTLMVVASISVGLFAIGIIANIYAVVAKDMRSGYIAVNAASIYIQSSLFDDDMVNALRRVEGVREAEGARLVDLRVKDRSDAWTSARLQAVDDWETMPINRLTLKQGTWPPASGEVVVEQYKFDDLGASLGDMLVFEREDGTIRELKLVGVVQDLTVGAFSGGAGFFYAPVMAYISQHSLDGLGAEYTGRYNGLYVTLNSSGDDPALRASVADSLTDKMEDSGLDVYSARSISSVEHPNAYLVNAIVGILLVLGLLVVFLSGFLITSTLQALLGQQVTQIGIMKSVGARQLQIAGVYMMLIFIFGLLAFAAAAPLAHQLSYLLLRFLAGELNFVLQEQRVEPVVVVVQAVLALVMPQLAAWLPIARGTQVSVRHALNGDSSSEKPGHGRAAGAKHRPKTTKLRLLSRPMIISIRNTFRRKSRLALTLITLTLGGSMFIATFNVQVSLNKYVEQISQYFLSDVTVTLDRPYRVARIEQLLHEVPGVGYVEGWAVARSEMLQSSGASGDSVSLLAPPAGSPLVKPILLEGRWIAPGDRGAIALGELFMTRYPDLNVGDSITLKVNGDETDFTVVGFFQLSGKNGGFSAYTNFDYLSELTGQSNKALSYQVLANRTGLTAAEQDELAKAIEARLVAEGIQVNDLTTGSFMTGIAGSGFGILTTFLLFLAVLTALVGSIGLAGTMSMNVMERTREIGVLRAIGASDRMLMKMVLVEGLIIGTISYILGAALSFPISKLLSDGLSYAIFDAPSSFGFTITGFAIWLAVVVGLSIAASVIPARSASRLTIREVLAYE